MNTQNFNLDVAYIARLAQLKISPEEEKIFSEQLKTILSYLEKIRNLDLSNVAVFDTGCKNYDMLSSSLIEESISLTEVLSNAPTHNQDLFSVSRILE